MAGVLLGRLGGAPRAYGTCAVLRTVLGLGALGTVRLLDALEGGRGWWQGDG